MGCLTIRATIVPSDIHIAAECKNGIDISAQKVGDGIALTAECKNEKPIISATNKNTRLTLTAGLVCGIDLDIYEFLRVNEGPLIVEDGYLKVRRKLD